MSDARVMHRLDEVVSRTRKLRSHKTALIGWSLLVVTLVAMRLLEVSQGMFFGTMLAGIVATICASWWTARKRPEDRTQAALLIEETHPELDSRLLTAVQQKPSGENWEFSYLQTEVLSEVLTHSRSKTWAEAVPLKSLNFFQGGKMLAMLTCAVLACFSLWYQPHTELPLPADALAAVNSPNAHVEISVEPGDAEVERGTSLLVMARFNGDLPSDVTLVAIDENQQEIRIPLQKSLDDPLFGGRIADVQHNLKYHVEFDTSNSVEYSVTAFDYPALLKADASLTFPAYTSLQPEKVEDVRRISVVEGSTISLACELNKPVRAAALVDEDGKQVQLVANQDEKKQLTLAWNPEFKGSKTYRLELRDEAGRQNREPTEFVIQVLPNNPPDLKVAFPAKDILVSPLQEVSMQADASDDFGLLEYGLVYQKPDGAEEKRVLGENVKRADKASMEHMLALENLNVVPDELVSYYFYADDIGPDGNSRRTFSDMFFAEVRPFEETFRQVPPTKGKGAACKKLIDLQRKVVSGSWNLLRQEPSDPVTSNFEPGIKTLADSQAQIKGLAEELAALLDDPQQKKYCTIAIDAMSAASGQFTLAHTENSIEKLPAGRMFAQEAYQALLKLQSREKKLKQPSQSESKEPNECKNLNQQLNALELKNDRDRYETEKQAQSEEDEADQEALQVLNRLRELARRQEDLNDKVRELENALRNANSEQEKVELERRLKRLQEEQEELLRNTDELKEQMNSEKNRTKMADAREQVEKTRERIMRSSEALKEKQTSRALTEGTRAQRELETLKEEFRKQTAGQFDNAVRQLRNEVRELANKQQELGEKLSGDAPENSESKRSTLRDIPSQLPNREELANEFSEQKQKLADVLDQTAQLVQEAENTEPLLAKKLYEAVRDLRKYQPEESLENAARLARYGITAEAEKLEKQASAGIDRLKQGVEEAAKSILGNEGEALALANSELKSLAKSIEDELARNDPNFKKKESNTPGAADSDQPADQSKSGDVKQPGKTDSDKAGKGEQGASKQGEGKPGESSKPGDKPGTGQEGSQGQQGAGKQGQQGSDKPGEGDGKSSPSTSKPGNKPGEDKGQSPSQGQGQGESNSTLEPSPNSNQQPTESAGQKIATSMSTSSESEGGGSFGPHMPLTGGAFLEWSDRMRDVEEVLTNPELRSQIAMVRDRARQIRVDVKRHSKQPDWELVRTSIYGPMLELQQQVEEELARRDPDKTLVPIDRDPVPKQYSKLLQEYYKELARQR